MRIICTVTLLLLAPIGSAGAFTQTRFASEDMAHQRCPNEMVVWLPVPGNVFIRKGNPGYGTTQRGAYICEHDAIAAGNRGGH